MARPEGTKKIESPEKMLELFENYKRLLKLNPIIVVDFVGGKGSRAEREKERPLTMEGFENFCFKEGLTNDLSHYFANTDNRYEDYFAICLYIRKEIRQDQIEGGMAGIYNPSITQRLNGLVEKTQTDLNANVNILNIDPLE
tara:strand:- start:90 stop:515 length:426 start_codon:yes stop_codon:yes gene_type:complete